jgi:tRNA nucleotidyltransferase (CCA-adding enzyme)
MELGPADLESLDRRLHFRAALFESLSAASGLAADLPSMEGLKPSQWVARLEKLSRSAVYAVFLCTTDGELRQDLYNYLENWRHVKPKTNGDDLKKLGLPPGPRYQQVLQRLREAWLDEEVHSENDELKLLEGLIKEV